MDVQASKEASIYHLQALAREGGLSSKPHVYAIRVGLYSRKKTKALSISMI